MGFCDECPEYIITDEKLYDGLNGSLIHFSFYPFQLLCSIHEIISHGPSLCRICEENDDINNGIINMRTYGKKKHLTKMSCYFG